MIAANDTSLPLLVRLLLAKSLLTEEQLGDVRNARAKIPESLEEALVRAEIVKDFDIASTWAEHLGMKVVEDVPGLLDRCWNVAERVPAAVCRRRKCIVLWYEEGRIGVGCVDPTDLGTIEEIQFHTGSVVVPSVLSHGLYERIVSEIHGDRDRVAEISYRSEEVVQEVEEDLSAEVLLDLDRPVPDGKEGTVIHIVNLLLANALTENASDIHLERYENTVRVRYRIDGVLVERTPPPRPLWLPVVSRLKVIAKMDISERRIPQDGAIALRMGQVRADLRVSTVPTVYGEKMVIRILRKESTPENLESLGLSKKQARDMDRSVNASEGLVFVTGPTGSGKSTTLYTCLNRINKPTRNILTVEDPVEYRFEGLNQCNVRSKVGMTFGAALRAFLRQDPDIIMVGEVRDKETSEICLRAALTGHLVLSTLHTNGSLDAVFRLIDMGTEPFLLAPALRLVQAQRLIRRLCPACKVEEELPEDVAKGVGLEPGTKVFQPGSSSCVSCRGARYRGRIGLFEVVPITERLRRMVADRRPLDDLKDQARKEGVDFLEDSARQKLAEGVTSLEEVSDFLWDGGDE